MRRCLGWGWAWGALGLSACFGSGRATESVGSAGGAGTAGVAGAEAEQRLVAVQSELGALSAEASQFAAAYDAQVARAQDETTFDVEEALAFLDAAPMRFTAIADRLRALEDLVHEDAPSERGQTSAALHMAGHECESQIADGFWAHLRSFVSNLLGGPVPADNLYGAADDANRIRQAFNEKWQARIDACHKIANVSERNLCIARVSQESRTDFAQSASELADSGGFTVIKAVGAGVVGIGFTAGAAALSVPALGAITIGAVATVIAEDLIDVFLRPVPAAGEATAQPAVVVRVRPGTEISVPAGHYEVLAQPRGGSSVLGRVNVNAGGTAVASLTCPDSSVPAAGARDAAADDAGTRDAGVPDGGSTSPCERADQVPHPESGICVCAPHFWDWWGADNIARCLPFTCTDAPYDPVDNDCACPNGIPSATEEGGTVLVTCAFW